ncbi:hypothetical protein DY926_13265 [Komagataeibacter melaceti]|uniref:Uncharacterized protein n=1 Tax=Komagataeibacter melaceti TaxID=2766577 RepID=A0A371YXT6_9PROT|nr:hypothetical protein [Komagataeibacter melaceti]RFD19066.1 hypothetical protein DY926_13265 [Komagataeibacter melaceti]
MLNRKKNANRASILFKNGVSEDFVTDCLRLEHVLSCSGNGSNHVQFLLEEVPGESPFKLPEGFVKIVMAADPIGVQLARVTI